MAPDDDGALPQKRMRRLGRRFSPEDHWAQGRRSNAGRGCHRRTVGPASEEQCGRAVTVAESGRTLGECAAPLSVAAITEGLVVGRNQLSSSPSVSLGSVQELAAALATCLQRSQPPTPAVVWGDPSQPPPRPITPQVSGPVWDRGSGVPETAFREPLLCELTPLGFHLSQNVRDMIIKQLSQG